MAAASKPTFSPATKLIVASNLAVAGAIWHLIRKGETGQFIQTEQEMVQHSIEATLNDFDKLVEKLFPAAHQQDSAKPSSRHAATHARSIRRISGPGECDHCGIVAAWPPLNSHEFRVIYIGYCSPQCPIEIS